MNMLKSLVVPCPLPHLSELCLSSTNYLFIIVAIPDAVRDLKQQQEKYALLSKQYPRAKVAREANVRTQ